MEKVDEKKVKKPNEDMGETKVIGNLNEIIKDTKIKKESNNKVVTNQILQKSIKPQNKEANTISKQKSKTDEAKQPKEQAKKEIVNQTPKQEKLNSVKKPQEQTKSDIIKQAEEIVNNAEKTEYKKVKTKKSRKGLVFLLFLIFVILAGLILSTIFSLINMNNTKIMQGVKVNGIDVSNLTKKEAVELLNNKINNNDENFITVYRNGVTDTVQLEEIDGKFDVEKAVNEAYKIGREGNIVQCNYDILLTEIFKKNLKSNIEYDKEKLENKIDEISSKIPDIALNASYEISDNNVVIKNSKAGYKINNEEFEKKMVEEFSSETKKFEIPVEKVEKQKINLEKIHKEIYKEAKDAYYTKNPYKVYKEETGLDFAISMEEAEKLLLEDKDEYTIPLKVLEPSVKVSNLDSGAFPDQLSTFSTYYGTGDAGRCYNIYLASKSITETVVMPGETFSFNDLIGECSTRTGYRESTIYLNGELSRGIGGGICQVSTTLYNAVVRANLEIVQRRNHSLSVTYVPLGQDAMVSIGSSDFQFKNNRDYPIKVVSSTGTGSITCQIYGLKTDTEYEVKLETKVISKTATNTKTQTYKVLYLNGREVSRTLLSTDSYKSH
jgi:vancomycin resistance protein YoaR